MDFFSSKLRFYCCYYFLMQAGRLYVSEKYWINAQGSMCTLSILSQNPRLQC